MNDIKITRFTTPNPTTESVEEGWKEFLEKWGAKIGPNAKYWGDKIWEDLKLLLQERSKEGVGEPGKCCRECIAPMSDDCLDEKCMCHAKNDVGVNRWDGNPKEEKSVGSYKYVDKGII